MGQKFKAHGRVLSEASPFFEKLLNSDMRETSEGIVRLEMLTELCLRDILEFIYTGSVQISAEDNAQDLIAMADYLVLPHLKTLAEADLEGVDWVASHPPYKNSPHAEKDYKLEKLFDILVPT